MKFKISALLLALIFLLASCASAPDTSEPASSPESRPTYSESASDGASLPEISGEETESLPETSEDVIIYPDREWNYIRSTQAFVYDTATDVMQVVKGNSAEVVYPASITKLFTVLTALDFVSPDDVVTAGDELELVAPDASIAWIRKGHTLKISMIIEGMLLPSGNDAAYILAAAAGRAAAGNKDLSGADAVAFFMEKVNEKAATLGMRDTHFSNPDGYEADDHYTSMRDLLTVAKLALECDVIMQYTTLCTADVVYVSGECMTWNNSNKLIDPASEYYTRTAIGLKTGTTDQAGNCLLSAFKGPQGNTIIIGTFRCPTRNGRYTDTLSLYYEYLEKNYE